VGTPVIANDAGTPSSVTVFEFAAPVAIVYVGDAVEITLPEPAVLSKVVSEKLSSPGGTEGPGTVQGHEAGVIFVVTLVTNPDGGVAPLTVLSTIATDLIFAVTYFGETGLEEAADDEDAFDITNTKLVFTRFAAGVIGFVDAGEPTPPPPEHEASASAQSNAI